MRQTAVQWLFEQLCETPKDKFQWYYLFEKAKEMERQQIIEAHGKKLKKTQTSGNYEYWLTGENYYKENYLDQ